jgi:PHD/YefM family antitoxin component YafN of YafNO toxin-antitoxin module
VLDACAFEPVLIRKQKRDVAVVMSMGEYERLTQLNVLEFQRFCDRAGANAAAAGMTEATLAELLRD